jgi:hypothetical protein
MRTKVSFNTSKSHSLKSTIPEGIAEALKLDASSFVEWNLEVREDKIIAVVKKAEN